LTFTATGDDPGSDDLTFAWSSGGSSTAFNDGSRPDADLSPGGRYPFRATTTTSATLPLGLSRERVTVTDDDGGSASVDVPVVVTGTSPCTFTQGYWQKQFATSGARQVPPAVSGAYLGAVAFASSVFGDVTPLASEQDARAILESQDPSMRTHATSQLLAAWLNVANGGVTMRSRVDTDGDGIRDMTVKDVVTTAERALLDPAATHADLERANVLAEAVNLSAHTC
jgi:hypothetical protein